MSTCRCRREPKWLFSFRLKYLNLKCIKKEMGFSSFCALIFCILLTYPMCWALWLCRELCNAWLGTAEWAVLELVYISYFFILWGKKVKNCSTGGKQYDQGKDEFNKQPHGIWCTLGVPVILSCSTPPQPTNGSLCKRFGSKKLVSWVSWCLPCFPVTHMLFLALREKTRLLDQYCNSVESFPIKTIMWLSKLAYLRPNAILIKANFSFYYLFQALWSLYKLTNTSIFFKFCSSSLKSTAVG